MTIQSSNSIFDFVFLAPSHVQRGRILERLGRQKQAAEHYRKALELYKESDPEFEPLVREAREGLVRLTAGTPAGTSAIPGRPGRSATQQLGAQTIASRKDLSPAHRTAR